MPVLCDLVLNFYVYQLLLENKKKAPILYLSMVPGLVTSASFENLLDMRILRSTQT